MYVDNGGIGLFIHVVNVYVYTPGPRMGRDHADICCNHNELGI